MIVCLSFDISTPPFGRIANPTELETAKYAGTKKVRPAYADLMLSNIF